MAFVTDQQTLDDLNIFGKHGSDSVYQIFNRTITRGGAMLLEDMFRYPLSDEHAINRRINIVQYFAKNGTVFPFSSSDFDLIEPYLNSKDERTRLSAQEQTITAKLSNLVAVDANTLMIHKGIIALSELFAQVKAFINALEPESSHPYHADKGEIALLLNEAAFKDVLNRSSKLKWSTAELAEYDAIFRFRHRDLVLKLMHYLYDLDIYITLAKVASERGFTFPKAHTENYTRVDGLYHPQVKNPVPNSIEISPKSNVVFLTGANMAGKSTFMKSLSVALYLAHMGFPVAASSMEFTVLDGIYTTINLPDDLGMGASHFYAEVLRAKKVAAALKTKRLFVVFDELFRGTNVKDACEATIAFTTAFAAKRDSIFVISTHIIEAADTLREKCDNINFVYLPTLMNGTQPVYTYQLKQGISADRHGMIIIKNEGILDLLAEKTANPKKEVVENFIADKQSLTDLNLLGKYKSNSIFNLFNKTVTSGGERLLQEMFQHPLTDANKINTRSKHFSFFQQQQLSFPFKKETFALAENYLEIGTSGNYFASTTSITLKKLQDVFLRDDTYKGIHEGLLASISVLNAFQYFLQRLNIEVSWVYNEERDKLLAIFGDKRLVWLRAEKKTNELSFSQIIRYDYLLRHTMRKEMVFVLDSIYRLDVYLAVANTAKERGFAYPEALSKEINVLRSTALWHPSLLNGIANPVSLHQDQNMIFLTGANMAGKSTFMKAFGIAIYLAHMGFPVAAKDMQFSVMDGLYSSINVADDLNMGYSHFYAEVLRVKKVATEVGQRKNLVVLFDELFKGTNVKDAYDATLAATEAFSNYRNCFFIISTHIIEVGEALRNSKSNLQFAYLPTVLEGNRPKYTYNLKNGITKDRQGMMIIENEGILEMLQEPIL
ncbi:DNA mismatch repair protein MutS [compost metagenome]|uniref:MutS-related protein n=1 Tax=Pedobacter sp. ok626 TaxID=1761882 RepID=UPI0008865AE0|nr:hypothetical protein [Pedobacter sp. ok626]SDJ93583.1 MutS domain III [Pedobacter sp. ok626]